MHGGILPQVGGGKIPGPIRLPPVRLRNLALAIIKTQLSAGRERSRFVTRPSGLPACRSTVLGPLTALWRGSAGGLVSGPSDSLPSPVGAFGNLGVAPLELGVGPLFLTGEIQGGNSGEYSSANLAGLRRQCGGGTTANVAGLTGFSGVSKGVRRVRAGVFRP